MSQPVASSAAWGEAPELLQVRMLNEYAYCPRLAYLEWVEGEFRDDQSRKWKARRKSRKPKGEEKNSGAEFDGESLAFRTPFSAFETVHARTLLAELAEYPNFCTR